MAPRVASPVTPTMVPELAALPDAYIHAPWDAPKADLAAAGIPLSTCCYMYGWVREELIQCYDAERAAANRELCGGGA